MQAYGEFCAEWQAVGSGGEDSEATWGNLRDTITASIEAYESVIPPEGLEEHHKFRLRLYRVLKGAMETKDLNDTAHAEELLAPMMVLMGESQKADASLSEADRAVLVATGCLDDS